MTCAGASSPGNVWAFSGANGVEGNLPGTVSALRLLNGRWTFVRDFPGNYVSGCNVIGPGNVWVFGGGARIGPAIGTWHLAGSRWTELNTGKIVLINGSVVGPSDIWATATNTRTGAPVIERWNGHSWRPAGSITSVLPKLTKTTQVGLQAVNALSGSNVWVLADVFRRSAESVVVVHWDGHKWGRVKPGSAGYYLPTAVSDGHGGWWSVNYLANVPERYLVHRVGGRWVQGPLPARLDLAIGAFAHVPHTNAMLAVGDQFTSGHFEGVVLAFGRL